MNIFQVRCAYRISKSTRYIVCLSRHFTTDAQAYVQRVVIDKWGTKFDRKPQSNPVWSAMSVCVVARLCLGVTARSAYTIQRSNEATESEARRVLPVSQSLCVVLW
jgi:hypothetical protein